MFYFGIIFQTTGIQDLLQYDPLIIKTEEESKEFANKKILVLGPDITPYYYAKQATPYFNWHLSANQLTRLDFYDNLEAIDKNLRSDMPEYIIDQIGLAPKLFEQIPMIGAEYEYIANGIYKRIKFNS